MEGEKKTKMVGVIQNRQKSLIFTVVPKQRVMKKAMVLVIKAKITMIQIILVAMITIPI